MITVLMFLELLGQWVAKGGRRRRFGNKEVEVDFIGCTLHRGQCGHMVMMKMMMAIMMTRMAMMVRVDDDDKKVSVDFIGCTLAGVGRGNYAIWATSSHFSLKWAIKQN